MKVNLLYLDNSNFFIEGQRLSAVKKKLGVSSIFEAMQRGVLDNSFRLDYSKARDVFDAHGRHALKYVFASTRKNYQTFNFGVIEREGFIVRVFERTHKEKRVDNALSDRMRDDAWNCPEGIAGMTLVAGDADYFDIVDKIQSAGIPVTVMFWSHATSRDLRNIAARFIALDNYNLEHNVRWNQWNFAV